MDTDILTIEDVAGVLKQDCASVRVMFEEGVLPGKRIGSQWYISRRRLVEFIEQGLEPAPPPKAPPARDRPGTIFGRAAGNAWVCETCGAKNSAERVACSECKGIRNIPLINYIPRDS